MTDFYRYIDLPFFDEDLLKELNDTVSYRLDRRLFDNVFYETMGTMHVTRDVFKPVWDFCLGSTISLTPLFLRFIKPRSSTPLLTTTDPIAMSQSMIDIPIMQPNPEHKMLFYEETNRDCTHPDLILVRDRPVLMGVNSSNRSILNDSDTWMVSLILLLHARYDLVIDVIERNMLFDGDVVSISESP